LTFTFNGTLKVRFFSFFSVAGSAAACSSALVLDVLLFPLSVWMLSLFPSELFPAADSAETFDEMVEFSTVKFFLGTSTHSVISITASALSRERIPLLLREKCMLALMGDDRFRDEYLEKQRRNKDIRASESLILHEKQFVKGLK